MRRFSDKEKGYIHKICAARRKENGVAYYAMDLLFEIFEGDDIVLSHEESNNGEVIFTCEFGEETGFPPVTKRHQVLHDIYDAALLLNDLESDGYINYIELEERPKEINSIILKYDKNCETLTVPSDIAKRLSKEVFCKSQVTQTLFELHDAGFMTMEDRTLDEARKQTKIAQDSLREAKEQTLKAEKTLEKAIQQAKYSWLAVVIALITLLVNVFSPCIKCILARFDICT